MSTTLPEWSRSEGMDMRVVDAAIANGRLRVEADESMRSTSIWRWGKVEVRRRAAYTADAWQFHVWCGDKFLWAGYGPRE